MFVVKSKEMCSHRWPTEQWYNISNDRDNEADGKTERETFTCENV